MKYQYRHPKRIAVLSAVGVVVAIVVVIVIVVIALQRWGLAG